MSARNDGGHTPGRLVVRGGYSIYTAEGDIPIADACDSIDCGSDEIEENARRLAACWNACDGIGTGSLLSGYALITAFQREQDRADKADRKCDELAEMLRAILDSGAGCQVLISLADGIGTDTDEGRAWLAARAAIAKAEAQP